jgi:A/G-specific adenine glycosylase
MPERRIPDYTQAIMDLGALVCTAKNPSCLLCPVQPNCAAYRDNRITELPTPKPKTNYPTKKACFLVLTDGLNLYLERRPSKGIWGGLWCLPEFHSLKDIQTWCNLRKLKPQMLEERAHLFTHYRLLFTPVVVRHPYTHRPRSDEEGGGASILLKDLQHYGLPAPIKRLIDDILPAT